MNTRNARYNNSGCLDMTAYLAMRNIQREEAAARKAAQRRNNRSVKSCGEICRSNENAERADKSVCRQSNAAKKPRSRRPNNGSRKSHGGRKARYQPTKRAAARKDGERYGE